MLLLFLLKGIVVGMVIAVPVGPVGILCLRRTIFEGRLAGLVSGLGAATAEAAGTTSRALIKSAPMALMERFTRSARITMNR